MDEQALFDTIANSKNPLQTIDGLKHQLTVSFIMNLNATTIEMLRGGDLHAALMISEWAMRAVEYTGDVLMKAHTLFNRGEATKKAGRLKEAEESFRQALEIYGTKGSPADITDCAGRLLLALESRGKTGEMENIARRALSAALSESGELSAEVGRGLVEIGKALRRQDERTLSRECFEALLQLAEQLGDTEYEAEACGQLAELAAKAEEYEKATRLYRRAIELDGERQEYELQAIDLANVGFVCYRQGDLEGAAKAYKECLDLREREGFEKGIEIDLRHAYHILHYLGRRKEALELFRKFNDLSPRHALEPGREIVGYPLALDDHGNELPFIIYG